MKSKMGTLRDRDLIAKISPSSLMFYHGNVHSQCGQDGILAEIFRRLRTEKGLFVEFGAWDGIHLSNCRYLYEKGWTGVFVEANAHRFGDLVKVYADRTDITLIQAIVGAPAHGVSGTPLIALLQQNGIDADTVTFVSIDVDGPDLEILQEIGFRPPVILIEGGFNFSPYLTSPIPRLIAWKNMQQPLAVIIQSAKAMGYTPVCFYQDTYLVRDDLAADLGRDAPTLYADAWHFAPRAHRDYMLSLRTGNQIIRQIEEKFFGRFGVNPLDYGR